MNKRHSNKHNSAKSQSDFIKFMMITGLGGLLILLLMFGIFFSIMSQDEKENNEAQNISEEETNLEELPLENVETGEVEKIIGVVSNEAKDNVIEIINVNTGEGIILNIEAGTELIDIYGEAMTLKEFRVGDIIQTKYDKGSRVPEFFRISGEAWEKEGVKDIKIDTELKTIEIGSNIYSYTDKIITTYKNSFLLIEDISVKDKLTIKGYQDKIWYISVEKSHGYITVNSSDKEGTVEIGNHLSMNLEEAKNIEVEEGSYKVVVKREGFEPFVKNVQVESGQNYEIDLGEMKKKVGKLQVIAKGLTDYKIYINDVEYPANEVILLEYGDYQMIVKKEGYKDWSKDFKIQQETNRIELELEKSTTSNSVKVIVDTNPQEAEVYIDDIYVGHSPIEKQVSFGHHNITLIKEGYSTFNFPINLEEGKKEKQFLFTLQEDDNKIEIEQNPEDIID